MIYNYINMKLDIHFPTLEEWSVADYHNLFETINEYQLRLLSSTSLKYSKWIYYPENMEKTTDIDLVINSVSKFNASN